MHDALLNFNPFTFWLQAFGADSSLFTAPSPGGPVKSARVHLMTHRREDCCLYVPAAAAHGTAPMVVMLHGAGQGPEDFAAGTAMNAAAERHGFVVLYPAQPFHISANRCWNWYGAAHQVRGEGEPARIAALTLSVTNKFSIDPSRVYVAGLSAGGAMAALLGELYPDIYAAVGVHSGLAPRAGTDLSSALAAMRGAERIEGRPSGMPTIVFHGDRDMTVHPVNGRNVIAAAVGSDCRVVEDEVCESNGRPFTRLKLRYPQGSVLIDAEHWVVHGAEHAWSGGSHTGSFADPAGPNASEAMLDFFKRQRMAHASRAASIL